MDISMIILHIVLLAILIFFSFFVKEPDEDEGIKYTLWVIRNFGYSLMFRGFILYLMILLLMRIINAMIELFGG
ncbi:MAG: hypothetical protein FWG67_00395 [Defluviitaleaceae bacterium]|nr:hypothetical protein [Defluviitaleaceae bacterium]